MFRMFGENLMDRWMNDMEREFFGRKPSDHPRQSWDLMRTDVHDLGDSFQADIELPGYKKDEIQLELRDGYLTIRAGKTVDNEQNDGDTGRAIRRERYSGRMSRSFYVGASLTEEDIKARLENGILSLQFPKEDKKPQLPEKKTILIEG